MYLFASHISLIAKKKQTKFDSDPWQDFDLILLPCNSSVLQAQTKPNTCATGGGACEAWASSANKDETSFGCPPPAPWSNQLDVSTDVVGWAARWMNLNIVELYVM